MAGDDNGKWIIGQSRTYGPGRLGVAQVLGDSSIGTHAAPGDPVFGPQDLLLKRRTQIEASDGERETDGLSGQEGGNTVGDRVDLGTRRRAGIREQGFSHLLGRKPGPGKEYMPDLRTPQVGRPQDGHRSEPRSAQAVKGLG